MRRQLSQDMNEGISPVDIRAGAGWAGGGSCAKALKQNVPGVARLWGPLRAVDRDNHADLGGRIWEAWRIVMRALDSIPSRMGSPWTVWVSNLTF